MFGRSSAAAVWVEVAGDAIHDSDWPSLPNELGYTNRKLQGSCKVLNGQGQLLYMVIMM